MSHCYMKRTIYNFNRIDENLSEYEVAELKAQYRHHHKKYWLFKQAFKYYKKIDLACNIRTVTLVTTGTIFRWRYTKSYCFKRLYFKNGTVKFFLIVEF